MNCVTCKHLQTFDCEHERIFLCGHPYLLELDANTGGKEIKRAAYFSDEDVRAPTWCPLVEKLVELPGQLSLFGDE